MDIRTLILNHLAANGAVKTADIVAKTGFSRAYVNRFLTELKREGVVVQLGRANQARYVRARKDIIEHAQKKLRAKIITLTGKTIDEAAVLARLKQETGIFMGMSENVRHIVDYAFTEMLNNALEHARSKHIRVSMRRTASAAVFEVRDLGIGVFNNVMIQRKLPDELASIQDILKGKQTTAPRTHSGQGIFFTSKMVDVFVLQSGHKEVVINNLIPDIFVRDRALLHGTRVTCTIGLQSKRTARAVFDEYTDQKTLEFTKTRVVVKLFELGVDFISRSEAKRIVAGLEKFKTIILDFKDVDTVGQGFADEIFRVWHSRYPDKKITATNANENIAFMIRRAGGDVVA